MAKDYIRVLLMMYGFVSCGMNATSAQLAFYDHNTLITHTIDRSTTLFSGGAYHTAMRYGDRMHLLNHALRVDTLHGVGELTRYDWQHLLRDIPERHRFIEDEKLIDDDLKLSKGIWGLFYKEPHSLWTVDVPGFYLKIDPVLNIRYGNDAKKRSNDISKHKRRKN